MGLTYLPIKITNPKNSHLTQRIKFLVDSGTLYSVVPEDALNSMQIIPHKNKEFILADGTSIKRKIGSVYYEYKGEKAAAPVIFGEKGDSILLGVTTLESLGLVLNSLNRTLIPIKPRM